ncbi:unnamed protein product [Rhodiola kirilowii]
MNCYAYEQSRVMTACEEMMTVEPLACPKPRRLGGWIADHIIPNTHCTNRQLEFSRANVGAGLLDRIMTEGGYSNDKSGGQMDSSPPFLYGSPPTRSSNPVVRDATFGSEKVKMPLLSSVKSPSPLSSPSSCKSRGARMKIGQKAVAVRIEGFDCLGGDRQNCNISAVA